MFKRLALLLLLFPALVHGAPMPATVIVLSTLHKMHDRVPAYGFDALGGVIERLAPDVLCLEVQPKDLQSRGPESVKQEYPRVIYPLLRQHAYRVYALEPPEPMFSALVKPYVASAAAFETDDPAAAKVLGTYTGSAYDALLLHWTSPARVNDGVTDAVFAGKHALQQALIGSGERRGWQGWNRHFLDVVTRAAHENPGKRIVVTVGAEHGYWLRRELKQVPGIVLADTAQLLEATEAGRTPVR